MIAQLDATVARPEIAWDGLLPILTLGVGALLLVLFAWVLGVGLSLEFGLLETAATFMGVLVANFISK